jgi:hypothetical protein
MLLDFLLMKNTLKGLKSQTNLHFASATHLEEEGHSAMLEAKKREILSLT